MRRFLLLFPIVFAATCLNAKIVMSKVAPEWNAPRAVFLPSDSTLKPDFDGAVHDEDGLPVFSLSRKAGANTDYAVSLENAVFADCSNEETLLLANSGLADSIRISISTSSFRSEKFLDIAFVPIICEDGIFKKLVSADLAIREMPAMRNSADDGDPAGRYKSSSLLSSGKWVKISVTSSGVHKLTYEDIAAMGFDNPADVAIYGYGGGILEEDFGKLGTLARPEDDLPQVPVYVSDGGDGVFSPGDYVLFYAQGPVKEIFDEEDGRFYSVSNYYSDKGYYFLTCNGNRKEMVSMPAENGSNIITTEYGLMHHRIASEETNLLKSGRRWYGYRFSTSDNSRSFELPFTGINIGRPLYVDAELIGYSRQMGTSFSLRLNNGTVQTLYPERITNTNYEVGKLASGNFILSSVKKDNPVINITYNGATSSDYGYVMGIDVNALCALDMKGGSLPVCYPYDRDRYDFMRYDISGAGEGTLVWDITNPLETGLMPTTPDGGKLTFTASHSAFRMFLAVDPSADFPKPSVYGDVANQNLHSMGQCGLVIVSPEEYRPAAETIAAMHREKDGMTVHIVTPQQVYNEFSSGTPDATAFRWFMKMFYDRAGSNEASMPQGILFIGNASYDNRGIENARLPQLSYQSEESLDEDYSYPSDDYFGFLDDGEGGSITTERMDIGVGRLPVSSLSEAQGIADKIVAYAGNSAYGNWRNMLTFVGDDGDSNIHSAGADRVAERMRDINKAFNANKIYFDSFPRELTTSGASFPQAKDRILRDLEAGTLVFTYFGHGSMNNLSHELIITRNDVQNLKTGNPAFWITAACDIGRYDTPGETSIGMDMINTPAGAGIAALTTTRVVYSGENETLCMRVFDHLIPDGGSAPASMGMAVAAGKGDTRSGANKMKYVFFGDPVLKLHYPAYKVVTDEINGTDPASAQMQALGVSSISGHIEDLHGNLLEDFSGQVDICVYDKEESVSTLDNQGTGAFVYNDFTSTIFNGSVSVDDGRFSTVFMVPKDINYSEGTGRIVYYAGNDAGNADAHGYNEDFGIYGTAESEESTSGPEIKMYMNHQSFTDGQSVNPSPVFYAHLWDSNGINTSGSGIGHNLSLWLNGDEALNMNGYFTADLNDYTSGTVKYKFNDLEEGRYELRFKAWNMQNQSSEKSLSFVVDKQARPSIISLSASPNPASDHVELVLEYDRPDNRATVDFYVYDAVGTPFFHETADLNTEGVYRCEWDLESSMGRAGTGLYIAKALITSEEGTRQSESIKILVIKQ